jgi:hypothetical protein
MPPTPATTKVFTTSALALSTYTDQTLTSATQANLQRSNGELRKTG